MDAYLKRLAWNDTLFPAIAGSETKTEPPSLVSLIRDGFQRNSIRHNTTGRMMNYLQESKKMKSRFGMKTYQIYSKKQVNDAYHNAQRARKSVDRITSNPLCLLRKLLKPQESNIRKEEGLRDNENGKPKPKASLKRYRTLKNLSKANNLPRSLMRKPSILPKSQENNKLATKNTTQSPDGAKQSIVQDDYILDYLSKLLSSYIVESIYFKDYYRLFFVYKTDIKRRYKYRSKSEARTGDWLTRRKLLYGNRCLYADYLDNLIVRYNMLKQSQTGQHANLTSNIFKNPYTKPFTTLKPAARSDSRRPSSRGLRFSFCGFNDDLKDFSLAVKKFNSTGVLMYEKPDPKLRLSKLGYSTITIKKEQSIPKVSTYAATIDQPVNITKSSALLQKIVHERVSADATRMKARMLKKKFTNCLQKSFFYLRQDIMAKQKMRDSCVTQVCPESDKFNYVDINHMYRIPRTMRMRSLSVNLIQKNASLGNNTKVK